MLFAGKNHTFGPRVETATRLAAERAVRPLSANLKSTVIRLAGANTNHAIDVGDEDLAVADLARLGGLQNGIDDLVGQLTAHGDLDAGLGNEVDHVLGTAIQLRMASLAPEALHFGDRHAGDADVGQCGTDVIELE